VERKPQLEGGELEHRRRRGQKSKAYQDGADAEATLRAYATDVANFHAWCTKHGFEAMPATPEVVGAYLAAAGEGYAMPTLRRRVAAIARACSVAGHPLDTKHPVIRETLRGIGAFPRVITNRRPARLIRTRLAANPQRSSMCSATLAASWMSFWLLNISTKSEAETCDLLAIACSHSDGPWLSPLSTRSRSS
jgi:hypothetical protein